MEKRNVRMKEVDTEAEKVADLAVKNIAVAAVGETAKGAIFVGKRVILPEIVGARNDIKLVVGYDKLDILRVQSGRIFFFNTKIIYQK